MAVSASGVLTLLFLLVCGPLFHVIKRCFKKNKKSTLLELKDANDDTKPTNGANVGDHDERETYKSVDYLFALIGYAIGIGNVWRFPYVIAQNGGAAALSAYLVCAVLAAVPIFLYEMIVGQHVRLSTIRCYEAIRPRWKSLGVAASVMLYIVLSYYGMVVGYTFPYIWGSLQYPLPWVEPGAESYWFDDILNLYDEDDGEPPSGPGPIQWKLALSLVVFWGIVFWCVSFGKKILAKITFVTVLLPVVLMIILVARALFLEGAVDGIRFYIWKFEFSQLLDVRVWATACSQIMFSLSPGFGTAITFSSYAKPKEDVYRACMIVAVSNSAFSIVGGLATFSIVGHLAHLDQVDVAQVATKSGTGLAFITLAEAMPYFGPLANAMSVLFFFMLFLLGLDSAYALLETVVSYVEDFMEEQKLSKRPATWQITGACTLGLLSLGLVFATRNGNSILDVVDHFVGTIFLLLVVFLESIMLIVDFGYKRLEYALAKATFGNKGTPQGRTLGPKWLCNLDFHYTVPAISGILGFYLLLDDARSRYGGYPNGLLAFGWILLFLLVATVCATLWKQDLGSLPPLSMEDVGSDEDDDLKTMSEYQSSLEEGKPSTTEPQGTPA